MTRAAAILAVLAVAATAALVSARALGIAGDQPAPASRLYVAISRSDDETAAHEIEVIDTASGERRLLDIGLRISALALSPDRRTLYVATDDGRVLLHDPNTGGFIAEIRTRRLTTLLPIGDDLYGVSGGREGSGAAVRIDVKARREVAATAVPGLAGRPAYAAGTLYVPYVDGARNALARLSVPSLETLETRVPNLVLGRTVFGAAHAHVLSDGALAYLGQWDSQRAGARLTVMSGDAPVSEVVLPVTQPGSERPLRGLLEVQSALTSGPSRAIHACVGNAEIAARYVVRGSAAERVGSECGAYIRAEDRLYLAVRGKGRVAVIDPASGRATRDLLLPGIPVAVATN